MLNFAIFGLVLTVAFARNGTREIIANVETVYEKPASPARGIVVLAHGCQHSATDFWPHSTACAECIGLPEEVRIARAIVAAGWVAVAFSSADREMSRCWEFEVDGPRVLRALSKFRHRHGLDELPAAALGASSGGDRVLRRCRRSASSAFVLMLARELPLRAVVSQIMALPPAMLQGYNGTPFPPTLFLHMPRDGRTAALVSKCVGRLSQQGRPDPRRSKWRETLCADEGLCALLPGRRPGEPDALVHDVSPVAEVLNVAWAQHEIVADYMPQTMEWIESEGTTGLAGARQRAEL
ncbi:hypothetical protein EMIHUDRAFT_218474 [Emiliania huxleyi CCMP1516]|uniref:Uncharacterized protein n=2 Tax=Emiliania huxleyi TaxID=2903 RepID=A0A0D3I8C5_EMIH1|nr:hypothetical protein EMIHUDRAFT_218474 [Emiliania huxleyi CCMP1516]EOD07510.1 hypothetical protein EMIHUDRAFT_218474 [Emiliania huxleyi CCMP1516]|eukprot:XP_005759939.1 hypothetical protein EMIHUDRAFT_218474 [Emiliania huxleyi CCMP1516]